MPNMYTCIYIYLYIYVYRTKIDTDTRSCGDKFDFKSHCLDGPKRPKYPNRRYPAKATVTTEHLDTSHTQFLGTLDPGFEDKESHMCIHAVYTYVDIYIYIDYIYSIHAYIRVYRPSGFGLVQDSHHKQSLAVPERTTSIIVPS